MNNSRRSFIQQVALMTAGLALPSSLFSCKPATEASGRKLGIQLYTLRDQLTKDVKDTIAKVAQAGYEQVETYFGYNGPGSTFWGLTTDQLKALLKEHNLTTPSGHYQLSDYLTLGNGKDEALKAQADLAAALGQEYFTIPVPPMDLIAKYPVPADDYKFVAAQLNKAGELLKKSNIKVAYHNHFWEFRKLADGKSTAYDILLNETDPALVHFELDLFWAKKAGQDPVQLFEKAPGRFPMWHVKDMSKDAPQPVADTGTIDLSKITNDIKFAEVGTGTIDFKAIFAKAKTAGVQYFFVEQDQITIDPFVSIKQSADYVKKNLF